MRVKQTERGWGGHFICADRCLFRRNTLLEHNDLKIVISTVGLMVDYHTKDFPNKRSFETIGHERYYETMAFHSDLTDTRYYDMNVEKQVSFESEWSIGELDADDKANTMHDNVVKEIKKRLKDGDKFEGYAY